MKPYVIFAPPYRANSLGVRVLYHLCDRLIKRGFNAYIYNPEHKVDENLKINFCKPEMYKDIYKHDPIAVYPEIVKGNPLNAKTVARYVLYYPGELGGEKVYDERELVFSYGRIFNSSISNRLCGNLFLPIPDFHIFKDYGMKRNGSCFWVGKGTFDASKLPPFSFPITKDMPTTREGLAMLFNTKEVFYCFDPSTSLMYEAPMCGCPTIMLTEDYARHYHTELGFNGCTYSDKHIGEAKATMNQVKHTYIELENNFNKQLDHFIKVSQEAV